MKASPNAGFINDDDFLPEFEQKEIEHQMKVESSLEVRKPPDENLKHLEEHGGILYKYDLPIEN